MSHWHEAPCGSPLLQNTYFCLFAVCRTLLPAGRCFLLPSCYCPNRSLSLSFFSAGTSRRISPKSGRTLDLTSKTFYFPLCNIFRHIISSFMTVKWHFIVLTICAINYLTNPGNFGHLDCFQFLCIRNNVAANFLSHRSPALGLVAYDKFLQVAGGV